MSNIRQRGINLRRQSIYVHQDFTEYISKFEKTMTLWQNNLYDFRKLAKFSLAL